MLINYNPSHINPTCVQIYPDLSDFDIAFINIHKYIVINLVIYIIHVFKRKFLLWMKWCKFPRSVNIWFCNIPADLVTICSQFGKRFYVTHSMPPVALQAVFLDIVLLVLQQVSAYSCILSCSLLVQATLNLNHISIHQFFSCEIVCCWYINIQKMILIWSQYWTWIHYPFGEFSSPFACSNKEVLLKVYGIEEAQNQRWSESSELF